jgi:hypothetical protein
VAPSVVPRDARTVARRAVAEHLGGELIRVDTVLSGLRLPQRAQRGVRCGARVGLAMAVLGVLEARLMRAEELRADQVAAQLGYGGPLRAVFDACQDTTPGRLHWYKRATAHHPTFARCAALLSQHNSHASEEDSVT